MPAIADDLAAVLSPLFSLDARAFVPSPIRALAPLLSDPTVISFAAGVPNPETFPAEALSAAAVRALSEMPTRVLQYDVTAGWAPLRERVAARSTSRGLPVSAKEILLTTGSQQGLDLCSRVLLDPGDAILVEVPTYVGALGTIAARRARPVGVRRDASGIDLDHLAATVARLRAAGTPVKALYTIPSFQNPSGLAMTKRAKDALAAACEKLGLFVLEDDPYGELGFEGSLEPADPTPLASRLPSRTAYLGSFSKTLAAGLRVGWLSGPAPFLAKAELAKQASDLCSSTFTAAVIDLYLAGNDYDAHLGRLRGFYEARKDVLLGAMREAFPPECRFTDPRGGLFTWVELPEGLDASELLPRAVAEERVAFVPGAPFVVEGEGRRFLRMTFAKEPPEKLVDGARRLGRLFGAALK